MTRCFVCNRIKEEKVNHWWALSLSALPDNKTSLTTAPLAAVAGVDERSYKAACGNSCAQKLTERYLQTGTLEPPRKPAGESA
jgi:hypothetical protein